METLFPVSLDALIIAAVGLIVPLMLYRKAKGEMNKAAESFRNDLLLVVEKSTENMGKLLTDTKADAITVINELKQDLADAPEVLGQKFAQTLAKSFGGMLSGDSRLDKGLAKRMVEDFTTSQDPMVQMILGQAKNTLPYLSEQPELMPQVAGLIQKFLPNVFGNKSENSPSQGQKEKKLGL